MLSGAPIKSHTGTVDLAAQGSGTDLTWRIDSTPSLPIPGAAWAVMMRPAITTLLRGVKRESERRARAGG